LIILKFEMSWLRVEGSCHHSKALGVYFVVGRMVLHEIDFRYETNRLPCIFICLFPLLPLSPSADAGATFASSEAHPILCNPKIY